jgi:hypothetical protein
MQTFPRLFVAMVSVLGIFSTLGGEPVRLYGAEPPASGRRYALLVGCSAYPSLPDSLQLTSAPNDIELLRTLLTRTYRFSDKDIQVLSEQSGGPDLRPTRANIQRAFVELKKKAGSGDHVVIWLSGHGSQQYAKDPSPTEEGKPDDLRQTFLPADIGKWDGATQTVRNAIVDFELRDWLRAITRRGAFVWLIVDACHSGTVARSLGTERSKEVPPELLIPREVWAQAQARARSDRLPEAPLDLPRETSGLVALYACQPEQRTVELRLPLRSEKAKQHGLLTYTLCQELMTARSRLTYRELGERIKRSYDRLGRNEIPLVEFKDQDRALFGQEFYPHAPFQLVRQRQGWKINAGALHGLTLGSILEVSPGEGAADPSAPVGHVRITALDALEAPVEPCAYNQRPAPEKLAAGSGCRPVYIEYGKLKLPVAVVLAVPAGGEVSPDRLASLEKALGEQEPRRRDLEDHVRRLAAAAGSLCEVVADPAAAEWLVCALGEQAYLLPRSALATYPAGPGRVEWVVRAGDRPTTYVVPAERPIAGGPAVRTPRYGPAAAGDALPAWLQERLNRIARAQALKALANVAVPDPARKDAGQVDAAVAVDLTLRRADTGQAIHWQPQGITLTPGEGIQLHVRSRSEDPLYVTVLAVDSDYGIHLLYPREGNSRLKLRGGQAVTVPHTVGDTGTTGQEHAIVIAVKARPEAAAEFGWLAQPGLAGLRAVRGAELNSPLGQLFQTALYGQRDVHGLPASAVKDYGIVANSWRIVPRAASKGSQPP